MNNKNMLLLAYIASLWLGVTLFTSFSLAAVFHILILITGIYFSFQQIKERSFKPSLSFYSLLALVIFSILSLVVNGGPYKNILKLKYFFLALLAVAPFRALAENYLDQKRVSLLIKIFLIASAVASLSGLVGLFTGFNPLRFKQACHESRACGMYGMYMSYAYGMANFVIVSTLGYFVWARKQKSLLYLGAFACLINLVGLYLSYARGALIASIAGFFVYLLLKAWKKALVFIILSSVIFGTLLISNEKFHQMFFAHNRSVSTEQRYGLYLAAIEAFKEKPMLGVGYKNFEDQSVQIKLRHKINIYTYFAGTAHNNFLEHLASTGILGFISLCFFHFFWAIEMFKRKDEVGYISLAFITTIFIAGQVQYILGDGETLFFIMFIYSWTQALRGVKLREIL